LTIILQTVSIQAFIWEGMLYLESSIIMISGSKGDYANPEGKRRGKEIEPAARFASLRLGSCGKRAELVYLMML
jgi:hypothetical protein